jgi:hypothetical protein
MPERKRKTTTPIGIAQTITTSISLYFINLYEFHEVPLNESGVIIAFKGERANGKGNKKQLKFCGICGEYAKYINWSNNGKSSFKQN